MLTLRAFMSLAVCAMTGCVLLGPAAGPGGGGGRPEERPFSIHWMVTRDIPDPARAPVPYAMDRETDLSGLPIEVGRNIIVYEQALKTYPRVWEREAGVHLMLRDPGSTRERPAYAEWRLNLARWTAEHRREVGRVVNAMVAGASGWEGVIILDFERVPALYDAARAWHDGGEWWGGQARAWDDAVRQINAVAFDPAFLALAAFEPPAGARRWADLRPDQREALARASYNRVSIGFLIASVGGARDAAPRAKIGFYDYPHGPYPFDPVLHGRMNDELGRPWGDLASSFWSAVDVLAPSIYVPRYTAEGDASPPEGMLKDTPAENERWYRAVFAEMGRVRDAYAPGAAVMPFVTYRYLDPRREHIPIPDPWMNDLNTRRQLELVRDLGADGLLVWGHYRNPPVGADDPEAVSAELKRTWGPLLRAQKRP